MGICFALPYATGKMNPNTAKVVLCVALTLVVVIFGVVMFLARVPLTIVLLAIGIAICMAGIGAYVAKKKTSFTPPAPDDRPF